MSSSARGALKEAALMPVTDRKGRKLRLLGELLKYYNVRTTITKKDVFRVIVIERGREGKVQKRLMRA